MSKYSVDLIDIPGLTSSRIPMMTRISIELPLNVPYGYIISPKITRYKNKNSHQEIFKGFVQLFHQLFQQLKKE